MRKILFYQRQNMEFLVEGGIPRGGAAVQTLVWMHAFRDLGFEVIQAKFKNDNRTILPEFQWVKTISIYDPQKNKKKLAWFTHRFPSIFQALKKSECQYLYISIPGWTTFFIGLMCKKLGIKKIIRIANDNILDERIAIDHKTNEAFFINLSLKYSDLTLTQNEFQFQTIKKKFPNSPVYKIFNPIIIKDEFLLPKKYSNDGYIAWVANFRYQKNLSLLFQIAKNLSGYSFKVAGTPLHPLDKETEESIVLLTNLPNVTFVGVLQRNEVLPFFSKAYFLLNTSRYEGFSNTFLEAMVTGTPILTTENANPDRIISHFNLGLVYNNEVDLSKSLHNISKNEYWIQSNNCINFVKENHDHLTLGKRLLNFLNE
jgi:glycosyltransferase involved in cell wall biosynthesis